MPQIVWCDPSDSSLSYGRGAQRARCGISGETHSGRAFAGSPPRLGSLIWNDQTTLAQAEPEPPAKAPSRPRRINQSFLGRIEKLGLLDSVEQWLEARELRNRLIHEYVEKMDQFKHDLDLAGNYTQMLVQTHQRIGDYANRIMNLTPEELGQ